MPFGAAWWYDNGTTVTRMLDLLAADPDAAANNFYFDAANLHLYSGMRSVPEIVKSYRDQMAAHGMNNKPIWVSETNAIPWDDPIWQAPKANLRATQDEQASYMVEAFATFLSVGVERISVNRAIDGTDFEAGGEPFGLIRNDRSTRPAFTAYQVVTRYFSGVTEGTLSQTTDGLTKAVLKRGSDRITVLWTMSPGGGTATVDALGTRALRVNKWGETSTIQADGGRFTINLAPATANSNPADRSEYVIGGDPVILVERADGNVQAAIRSLDENPTPGGIEAASAGNAGGSTQNKSNSGAKATPTPTPQKATPTPTPKRR